MSRARVKLTAPAEVEPPPDWWERLWYERQARGRELAVAYLHQVGRPLTASEIVQGPGIRRTAREVRHALDRLVESGVLRRFERAEPTSHGNGNATRTYTFYELAKE